MKKPEILAPENFVSSEDYKLWYCETEIKNNFESLTRWIYLGADIKNKSFAKIGLTMGNLASRSYSSSNPNYYLFCAFKCRHNITKEDLKIIEDEILSRIEKIHENSDGSSKRIKHYESGFLSECFDSVNFIEFFLDLHLEIYENHRNDFVISGWSEEDEGESYGSFVDCIFNPKIPLKEKNKYIRMILQYDY